MSNLDAELSRMKNENIDFLHYDVMDGIFVNNTSFDVKLLSKISKKFDFTYDVHLMIVEPKKTYKDYIDAGADYLTFHYEAMNSDEEVADLINLIKKDGCKAGLSIKELSDLLGAPYRTVQEWNAGRSKPVDWAERLIIEKLERMTADK